MTKRIHKHNIHGGKTDPYEFLSYPEPDAISWDACGPLNISPPSQPGDTVSSKAPRE